MRRVKVCILPAPGVIDAIATAISAAAAEECARTGRPSQLKHVATTAAMLDALAAGRSRSAAARAAGVSEAVIRRWLTPGMRPLRACEVLQRVDGRIAEGLPVTTDAVLQLPANVTPAAAIDAPIVAEPARAELTPVASPPSVTRHVPPPSVVARWHHRLARAMKCAHSDRSEATYLLGSVKRELATFGLTVASIPPAPARWLPPGLGFHERNAAYMHWCQDTGRDAPTDRELEMEAFRWYHAHVITG